MPGTKIEFTTRCSNRQREWFQEAMLRSNFPFDLAGLTLSIDGVDEPPCEGHNDYMCTETHYGPDTKPWSIVFLRNGTEDPSHPQNSGVPTVEGRKLFWLEAAIHEIGHAFTYGYLANTDERTARICSWFRYRQSTGTERIGTLADWSIGDSGDPWKDSISEAIAEWIKDLYLPSRYRWFSQRTNWDFRREMLEDFFDMIEEIICTAPPSDA